MESDEDFQKKFEQRICRVVDERLDERVKVLLNGFQAHFIGILNQKLEPIIKDAANANFKIQYATEEYGDLKDKLYSLARMLVKRGVLKQRRPQRQISSREVLNFGLVKAREYYDRVRIYFHKS